MQIIQSIRDKGAAIVIVVIALSLIGFILMDAKQGSSRLFGSSSNTIGEVNGKSIDLNEFNALVKEVEDQQPNNSGARSYENKERVWNELVRSSILSEEAEKLGLNRFTAKELQAIFLSNSPINPLMQDMEGRFIDPATGKIDITKALEVINNIKKGKLVKKENVESQIIKPIAEKVKRNRYSAMLNASIYYPTWMEKQDQEDTKKFSVFNFVNIPYSEIPDNTVKVTDADVTEFINKNKNMFKQEAGRGISYYSFSIAPSQEDSNSYKTQLDQLVSPFAADTNNTAFVASNGSTIEFPNKCIPKSILPCPAFVVDSIISRPIGSVYGPYHDPARSCYVIAKYIATKIIPDSVKSRHILISTTNPQTKQPLRSDADAKKLADSLLAAINSGSDFATLAAQFSGDEGSKAKGGDLPTVGFLNNFVPEFNEFLFNKPTGEKAVVKTDYGYHIIEIQSQINPKPGYNIAFINKDVLASEATISKSTLEATKTSSMKDVKALTSYAAKNGLKQITVPGIILENDFAFAGISDARQLIKWAFDAKKGEVSEPFNVGNQLIVAVVDKVYEKGTMDVASARIKIIRPLSNISCETYLRNQKKAELIKKKLGNNPTLESASAAYNKTIVEVGADSSINFSATTVGNAGDEPILIGAAFNKDYMNKPSPAFAGTAGVFVIKVKDIQSRPADSPEMARIMAAQRKNELRVQLSGWEQSLKECADIEDNRSKFY